MLFSVQKAWVRPLIGRLMSHNPFPESMVLKFPDAYMHQHTQCVLGGVYMRKRRLDSPFV